MKWYITFGQVHVHHVNGKTFDKDCVAVINGPSAEQCDKWAFEWFEGKFHGHSDRLPPMGYYPRGLIEVNPAEEPEPEPDRLECWANTMRFPDGSIQVEFFDSAKLAGIRSTTTIGLVRFAVHMREVREGDPTPEEIERLKELKTPCVGDEW